MRLLNARPDSSPWRGRQPRPEPRGPRLPPRPSWMRGRGPAPPAELQLEAQTTRGVSGHAAAVTRGPGPCPPGHTVQGPVQTGETSPSSEKEEKPSFLLSWPPGFLFAMRRPLPGAWGHSRRSGRPRRPRGLLRLRAPVCPDTPRPCSRPAPGLGSGWPQRPARQVSESPAPGDGAGAGPGPRAAPGASLVSRTRRKSQGVTGHRRPQRPRGDSGRSFRARGPDAAPRAAPRGQRQSGLRRAMLAVSRR